MVIWLVSQWKADIGAHWSLLVRWSNWSISCRQWRLQTSAASTHAEVWRSTHRQRWRSWESRSLINEQSKSSAYLAMLRPPGKAAPTRQGDGWSPFSQLLRHTCRQSNGHTWSLIKHAQVTFIMRSLYVCRWPALFSTLKQWIVDDVREEIHFSKVCRKMMQNFKWKDTKWNSMA